MLTFFEVASLNTQSPGKRTSMRALPHVSQAELTAALYVKPIMAQLQKRSERALSSVSKREPHGCGHSTGPCYRFLTAHRCPMKSHLPNCNFTLPIHLAHERLPHIRITDVLLEVRRWIGFNPLCTAIRTSSPRRIKSGCRSSSSPMPSISKMDAA